MQAYGVVTCSQTEFFLNCGIILLYPLKIVQFPENTPGGIGEHLQAFHQLPDEFFF